MTDERFQRIEEKLDQCIDRVGDYRTDVQQLAANLSYMFNPEFGDFTKTKAKVEAHDKDITRAKAILGLFSVGTILAIAKTYWGKL